MADIESLREALAVSPDNIPLILMLAETHLERFSLVEAREQFERALALDPAHPAAKVGLARILHLDGRTSEAVLRLEALCRDVPDHAPAWMLRAVLALEEDGGPVARGHYDRALALDPELASEDLLKRIRQAGGGAGHGGDSGAGSMIPQAGSDGQTGAYFDPDAGGGEETPDEFDSFPDADADGMPDGSACDLELEFMEKTDIDFSKVGGMDAVKENIRMKILYPLQNKELFEAYGKKAGGGVLLYGPPGCGKTMISRATAGEISAKFFSIGLHQILDMWIGKSEEKLHEIFELARRRAPSVLFFDEVDALAADRKDMRTSAGRTLINQFLAELDSESSDNDGVLVLGATNAPWHLDSAFLRPGRFDRVIFVPPPDQSARSEIVRIQAAGKPVTGLDPDALAKRTGDFSGADIKAVFDQAIETALAAAMKSGNIVPVTARQLAKTAKTVKPSTRKWFESAKNHALYANQSGFYDDVLDYLNIKKKP